MYDDFNELFWDVERVKKLLPLSGTPEQASAQFCASAILPRLRRARAARDGRVPPLSRAAVRGGEARGRRDGRAPRATNGHRTARRWAGHACTSDATRLESEARVAVASLHASPRRLLPSTTGTAYRVFIFNAVLLHAMLVTAFEDGKAVVALPLDRDRHALAADGVAPRSRHLADAPLAVQGERSSAQFWRKRGAIQAPARRPARPSRSSRCCARSSPSSRCPRSASSNTSSASTEFRVRRFARRSRPPPPA